MSKAEERALEAFPLKIDGDSRGSYDSNVANRIVYQQGYEQAEKDLELTWEDMSSLKVLLDEVENEFKKGQHEDKDYIGYCKEVLKRFKAQKGENI